MISFGTFLIIVSLVVIIWGRKARPATKRLHIYESKPQKNAIDHYQIAAEYDYELGDRQHATAHYRQALAMAGAEDWFIIDRIGQRMAQRATQPDENHQFDLDLDWDMIQPARPQTQVRWHEDTQNVHDTLLSDGVADNYRAIKSDAPVTPITTIMREIQDPDAVQMLGYINRHECYVTKLADTEARIVQEVWKQVKQVGTHDIMQSFCGSLADSWNGGSPYCVTGRTSRVIQSLAYMVPGQEPLKTREVLRNEIFNTASQLLKGEISRADLEEVWQKNDPTEDEEAAMAQVQERARAKISTMVDGYSLAEADASRIKAECYAGLD